MADIDISKIKVGDEVTVRAIVSYVGEFSIGAKTADGEPQRFRALPEAIVSHTPKPLAVGDRVRDDEGDTWEIATPKREASLVQAEYALWSPVEGYAVDNAARVEAWERVS